MVTGSPQPRQRAHKPVCFQNRRTRFHTGVSGIRYYNPDTGRWLNRDPLELVRDVGFEPSYVFSLNSAWSSFDLLGLATMIIGVGYDTSTGPNDIDAKAFLPAYVKQVEAMLKKCCEKSACECSNYDEAKWCKNIVQVAKDSNSENKPAPPTEYNIAGDAAKVIKYIKEIKTNPAPTVKVLLTNRRLKSKSPDAGGVGFVSAGAIIQVGGPTKVLAHELGHVVGYHRPENSNDPAHAPKVESDNLMRGTSFGSDPDCQWCEKILGIMK